MTKAEQLAHYERIGGLEHAEPRKPTSEELQGMPVGGGPIRRMALEETIAMYPAPVRLS